jgi:hypothetical protein
MFVMFTDDLFEGFETVSNTLTVLWYGQEELGYLALLIRLECCTINICAANISQKVISLQLKGYALRDLQFHVAQILLQSLPQPPDPSMPSFDPLPSGLTPERDLNVLPPIRTYSKTLVPSAVAPVPIQADSPSTFFQMSAIQP